MGRAAARLEADRLAKRGLRLVGPPRLGERYAERVARQGVARARDERRLQLRDRGLRLAAVQQLDPTLARGLGRRRLRRALRERQRQRDGSGRHGWPAGGAGFGLPSRTIRTTARRSSPSASSPRSCALSRDTRASSSCAFSRSPFRRYASDSV